LIRIGSNRKSEIPLWLPDELFGKYVP
jgi:hypothetical protein